MGRQHQGMDRPGVRQVPEDSGEQGKMEKTGCKIICGAPTTLAVEVLMIMMMMIMMNKYEDYKMNQVKKKIFLVFCFKTCPFDFVVSVRVGASAMVRLGAMFAQMYTLHSQRTSRLTHTR